MADNKQFNEIAFDGAVEIVAGALEETEVELSAEGGAKVGEFFAALYQRLAAIVEGEPEQPAGKPGIFEIYQDAGGQFRFRLKAANGEVIAVSEGYATKAACQKGIDSVCRSSKGAKVKEV